MTTTVEQQHLKAKQTAFGYRQAHFHRYDYETDFFSSMTTYHGLVRVYNADKWWGRWFWFCCVLCAFIIFTVMGLNLLHELMKHPTSTEINFTVPDDLGQVFPTITICNFNPIVQSKAKDPNLYFMNDDELRYASMANMIPESYYYDEFTNEAELEALDIKWKNYTQRYYEATGKEFDFYQFFNETGFTCEEMVRGCWYGATVLDDCCHNAREIITDFGKCIQFRHFDPPARHRSKDNVNPRPVNPANRSSLQYISGAQYGLDLLLDTKVHEMSPNIVADFFDVGFKFIVSTAMEYPMMSLHGHTVGPGQKVYTSIKKSEVTLLPKDEWGNCIYNWSELVVDKKVLVYDDVLYRLGYSYTSNNCVSNCLGCLFGYFCTEQPTSDETELDPCTPQRYSLTNLYNRKVCRPYSLKKCMKNILDNIGNPFVLQELLTQSCRCDVECERTVYDTEMSYTKIPNIAALKKMSHQYNVSQEYIENNFVIMSTYIKNAFYEQHTQKKALTRGGVLSQIGGTMGLTMGMSLVTMAEIAVFMLKTIWDMCRDSRKRINNTVHHRGRPVADSDPAYKLSSNELFRKQTEGPLKFTYENDLSNYSTMYDAPDWYENSAENSGYRSMFGMGGRSRSPSNVQYD